MKYSVLLMSILCFNGIIFSQKTNPNYDAELAKSLSADDYGMKKYIFVLLKTGENTSTNQEFIDSCFAGHIIIFSD